MNSLNKNFFLANLEHFLISFSNKKSYKLEKKII